MNSIWNELNKPRFNIGFWFVIILFFFYFDISQSSGYLLLFFISADHNLVGILKKNQWNSKLEKQGKPNSWPR